jgi:hypothetical protein
MQEHAPLLAMIVSALKHGIDHAHVYAEWQDEDIDRALAPALVRKGAKRYLFEHGEAAEDEEDGATDVSEVEFQAEHLPNLGLCIEANGVRIRILRSDRGNMPVAGKSRRRQEYYAQMLPLFDPVGVGITADIATPLNLVLHWNPDTDYNLDTVYLGCPKKGGETRASVEAHWDELIWRKHEITSHGTQVEAEVTDLSEIRLETATGTDQ